MRPRLSPRLAAALAVLAAGQAAAAPMTVPIDQSVRIGLNGQAASVFVGNPSIADVVMVDRRTMMVVGRGYGVTNVVALDGAGRTLADQQVLVSGGDVGRVTVQRGGTLSNYACAPRCERSPMPGENQPTFEPYNASYGAYQGRASTAAGAGAGAAPEGPRG